MLCLNLFNKFIFLVPDYEVVLIHWPRLQERDVQNKSIVQMTAFGDHIKLWLNPTEGILASRNTPTYIAKTRPNGTSIRKLPHVKKLPKYKQMNNLNRFKMIHNRNFFLLS